MKVASRQIGGILLIDLSEGQESLRSHSDGRRIMPEGTGNGQHEPSRSGKSDRHQSGELASLDTHSDEILFDAYREGDRIAFKNLMRRYSNELLHFLTRFLGSRVGAEDVFQETFLQIHLSADTFDSSRRFKPWLFTIAANKARDYHRKHSRRTFVSLSSSLDSDGDGQCFVDLMESNIPTPEAPLVDAERCRLVKGVVDSMPSHLREILLLSYFQQMSYNQIAETLEIPLGTVKSRLHTAVAAFARTWKAAMVREGRAS